MGRKCIAKLMNKKTKRVFALISNGDGTYTVLKLHENYNGKVRGGFTQSWFDVISNVDKIAARNCFYSKIGPQE